MSLDAITIVELSQPRCALRFGVGACVPVGAPPCYNTFGTCKSTDTYEGSGSIKWRFIQDRPGTFAFGDFADPNNLATNCIPVPRLDVTKSTAILNAAGVLSGQSPAGIRARVTVSMPDFPWDDHVGDFNIAVRGDLPARDFWRMFNARNAYYGGMYLTIYDGYVGQEIADMVKRVYVVEGIDGPSGRGAGVTIEAIDPLTLVTSRSAKFPEELACTLKDGITHSVTAFRVYTSEPAKLSKAYGNTATKYARIGNEVLGYTGVTTIAAGEYELTGVTRGVIGTAVAADAGDAFARVGRYVNKLTWEVGYDLLANHTTVPSGFIDLATWTAEGDGYLGLYYSTAWVVTPTLVDTLLGEVAQQGMFYFWWDERAQKIPMLAVRPPIGFVARLTGAAHIVEGSAAVQRRPDDLITRVFVYYSQRDSLASQSDPSNYKVVSGQIEGDTERAEAADGERPLSIFARWVSAESHAAQIVQRILARYKNNPTFLSIAIDAKDRHITIGDVVDVDIERDSQGFVVDSRWQVVSWDEAKAGEVYILNMQNYTYIGRFGVWMADGSPNYASATDEEKLTGSWWAGSDGLMPDGSPPYQWQ